PWRKRRSASTAKASPRNDRAAEVVIDPASVSGALRATLSSAAAARSTCTATAPRTSGSSEAALPDSSDSRANWASLRAGTTARRHSDSALRRFRARIRRARTTMAITSTMITTMSAHGVLEDVVACGVVLAVVGATVVVVVRGGALELVTGMDEVVVVGAAVVGGAEVVTG